MWLTPTLRRVWLVCGTAILAGPIAAGAQTVRTDTVYAPSLTRRVEYRVVLPAGYDPRRAYPVLWLLHGYGGGDEDWLQHTPLLQDLARYPLIVILPGAENSWYVNAVADASARYETFMLRDLYDDVRRRFSVDTLRQGVAGLSMGGYGAVLLALRHPERYRLAGGLSAALSVPAESDSVLERIAGPSLEHAFGRGPAARRAVNDSAYDPMRLVHRAPVDKLPYFFLAIGTSDGFPTFLPSNRAFTDSLRVRHARYEYHELPGRHSWQFWGAELAPLLERLWAELNPVRPDSLR